jgi:hypothetical protein
MRSIVYGVIVISLILSLWIGLLLRPWMTPGSPVFLTKTNIAQYQIQLWQKKNPYLLEPFSTDLFVKSNGQPWKLYIIDQQDTYRPNAKVRLENSTIIIELGNRPAAYFELTNGLFRKSLRGEPFIPMGVNGEPPGDP